MPRLARRLQPLPDYAAEHADISTGGIGNETDWTLTIVRTELGRAVIDAMVKDGAIETRPGDDDPGAIALMHRLAENSRKRWPDWAQPAAKVGISPSPPGGTRLPTRHRTRKGSHVARHRILGRPCLTVVLGDGRWVVDEVKDQRDLQITWQPFSLLLKNQPAEGTPYYDGVLRTYKMLRVMESVRATEGNEGMFALYWELGARIHHDKDREFDIADALEAAGLPAMHAEAFEDERFDTEIPAGTTPALRSRVTMSAPPSSPWTPPAAARASSVRSSRPSRIPKIPCGSGTVWSP